MKTNKILTVVITIAVLIIVIGVSFLGDVYAKRESYKDNLIRFHVIANSDSKDDQKLKIYVRDKVIAEMNEKFQHSSSIDETRKIIKENLDKIEYIAQNEVYKHGKDYDVNVYFDNYNFPTKSYGNFTLPAGEYKAVKIVIGEGKGKNWWCVMFPPLCFIDVTHGLTSKRTEGELKKILTEEEFNMIKNARSEEEIPIKLKFKIVELLEEGRMRFAKLFISQR